MFVNKAYRFRLYPNNEQINIIHRTIGCARFVFNHFLAKWNDHYIETGAGLSYKICSAKLPGLKQRFSWLKEVDSIALQTSVRHLDDAFKRFFKQQNASPRFKSKKNPVQSYTTKYTNGNIAIEGNRIKLPKLGTVRFAKSREVKGRIINVTIRKNASGAHFISILVEEEIQPLTKTCSVVGIDMGLTDFAVLSDGMTYPNPKFFQTMEQKLAKAQRKLARRTRGGANWDKQRRKVAKIHETIANARKDHFHKISTEIIKNHDVIGIESLAVKNLLKNGNLSKAISDVSWTQFQYMIEYKAKWYGKKVVKVGRNFPSSQQCSHCGRRNPAVKDLAIRKWECPNCRTRHDRDLNASINIRNEALRQTAGTAGIA